MINLLVRWLVRPSTDSRIDSAIDALLHAIYDGFRPLVAVVVNAFRRT